jgi:triacylglycerol lipase
VTLGSPHLDPLAVHPLVWVQGATLAALSAVGVRGLAGHRCRSGACCKRFWQDLSEPVPQGIEFVSIYSERDGIVDWRACLDPHAANMKVRSTHCGMGVNASVYELLDKVLHAPPARKPARHTPRRRVAHARAA